MKKVAAGEFKQTCLRLLDEVRDSREPIIVTKRGVPVAKLVPLAEETPGSWLGGMAGTVEITGDIVSPAMSEEEWIGPALAQWDEQNEDPA